MTAQEAYNKVISDQTKNEKQQLDLVVEIIEKAVEKNNLSVCVPGRLTDFIKKFLKDGGYKIEEGGRYNEVDTYISWDLS